MDEYKNGIRFNLQFWYFKQEEFGNKLTIYFCLKF